ncbi:hypothetical protein SPRG_16065 [Saprolegnia parasitica CBS 223.65]|uniref:Uncharacterized protein n=1 Tax=Saprolegnia parasitica (strain CBS 223.65) TaxID=695850 RepID=A0A067BPB6_SAPPC|nr:hypothetical protein SPRG_16065 [Saprolegnia parasitica CBS 223.65]KDO18600.1 hypothetical protein SPRG_16065 [Saprolegnia parasitica CBS 223.65]|eukprot:XP_012210694.1 hypothetical protein SPRG_16065 [Saprolegnia parasitica CBS 223.65]
MDPTQPRPPPPIMKRPPGKMSIAGDESIALSRPDLKAHLDAMWRSVSATLPRTYGARVAQSATLDKNKGPNDSFMLPNALL